jgi:pimeloyl-ACP methyl ester carboxylesterase
VIRRLTFALVMALLLAGGYGLWSSNFLGHSVAATAAPTTESYTIKDPDLFIYVPANAAQFQPVQILVAMHGMGGDGPSFCQGLLATAERNGWIVVAPTFKYQDYKNPDLVLQDDLTFLPRLKTMIDSVPARTGLETRNKVLLYGFSRGAQAVHRFATFYPDRTLAVAAISAGSYTLPLQTMLVNGRNQTIQLPFGVANMKASLGADFNYAAFKQVAFRISVGANDTNPDDVPRAWDPLLGTTRPDRAKNYTKSLQNIGVEANLAVYPGATHQVTQQMLDENLAFLQGIVARNAKRYGFGPTLAAVSYGAIANNTAKVTHR